MTTMSTVSLGRCERCPTRLKDLWDLTKPRMNVVVIATTWVGYLLSTTGAVDWIRLIEALMGTALAAAGASVLNQVMERGYDALMPRTANRPLPAGRIGPAEACLFGLVLSATGIALLAIDVNVVTACLGALTLITYLLIYTPAKRRTSLSTLFGAVPGAIPVMMGCTAATGQITATAIDLFLILFIWQIPHFLSIAVLYREDYAKGGFQILSVTDPDPDATGRQIVLYSLALVPVTLFPVALSTVGFTYFIIALVLNAIFTWYGTVFIRSRRRQDARRLFLVSVVYLLVLLLSMVVDHR